MNPPPSAILAAIAATLALAATVATAPFLAGPESPLATAAAILGAFAAVRICCSNAGI